MSEIISAKILEFSVQEKWYANELMQFLKVVRNAYNFFSLSDIKSDTLRTTLDLFYSTKKRFTPLHIYEESINIWDWLEPSASVGIDITPLEIYKINMASPGSISFKGLGEPIKELKDLFESIAFIFLKWKKEKADVELKNHQVKEKEIDLKRKEIENALILKKAEAEYCIDIEKKQLEVIEKKIEIMKKSGFDEKEIRKVMTEPLFGDIKSIGYLFTTEKVQLAEIRHDNILTT